MDRLMSFVGFFVIVAVAWLLSIDRRQFPWRIVLFGIAAQVFIALTMLNTHVGPYLARRVVSIVLHYYIFIDRGAVALVGEGYHDLPLLVQVVPSIVMIAAIAAVLYHLQVVQKLVEWIAAGVQPVLDISGVESVVGLASPLLGRVETLFLVRPFITGLTHSELNTLLVFGFSTLSLAVLNAILRLPFKQEVHLFTASLISVPAGLMIAKIMVPETQIPATLGRVDVVPPPLGATGLDALVLGLVDGIKVAVRVIAVAVVMLALIALTDRVLTQVGAWFGYPARLPGEGWSLRNVLKYAFAPLAWLMGFPQSDWLHAGELLGLRLLASDIVAYTQLKEWMAPKSGVEMSARSQIMLLYLLCGFANVITVGMQVAAIGALSPERQADAARLAWRALVGGTLACCLTACVAGLLV